jgi:signal transduction histidine kinase/ligand-binding sensor domain-containing protein
MRRFSRARAWHACRIAILPGMAACGLAGASPMEAPSQWLHRSWQTDEGLPDNSVTGLAQTGDGYMWVATRGGLLRFNGSAFMAIPLPEMEGISNRVVRSLYLDRRDRLWLGMERGRVICLERGNLRIYGPGDGLPEQVIRSMVDDARGNLWLTFPTGLARISAGECRVFGPDDGLTRTRGNTRVVVQANGEVAYMHGGQLGFFRDDVLVPALKLTNEMTEICAEASAGLWICEGASLRKFRDGVSTGEIAALPDQALPRVMLEDRSGALWIGTASDGLFRMEAGLMESIPTSHREVDCLLEDREGNLWAGTIGGGLNQVRPQVLTLIDRHAGLPTDSVRSVCEDASGRIWVALENGQLARLADGRWINAGPEAIDANCVAAARDGSVWLGSRDQGLHRIAGGQWQSWNHADGLAGKMVRSLLAASDGKIWIATDSPGRLHYLQNGEIHLIDMPPELPVLRSIRAMAEAADGTIWIGTARGELMRVAGDKLVRERATGPMNPISIRSLHATPDGTLWIAHAGAGIGQWRMGVQKRISSARGLVDDHVSQILTDRMGSMWVAGNRGLFQVKMAELMDVAEGRADRLRARVFGRAEGLAGLQASFEYSPSACAGRDGRLWFAMRNGLLMVRPENLRENPTPPPVILERVRVDDLTAAVYDKELSLIAPGAWRALELAGPAAELSLPPGHNKLEFEFAALSFTSPENVHFRYQLRGFDQKWIEAGTRNRATYPRLPGGSYEFRVIACNHAGVWNETGASLRLVVAPFYWQTWWFRGLALAFFTVGVIASVRYLSFRRLRENMRQLEQQAALHQERARIARDMHDEVGAKLTRLSLLSDMAAASPSLPPEADADVREISDTARETILAFDEIVWAVNPRNDTLGDLVGYLCRHAEELFEGGSTECVFDLPQTIPPVMLPTEVRHEVFLAAKEALTNVAKYAAAGQVRVRLTLHPAAFDLIIEDDGRGFDPAAIKTRPGGGNGLLNMRARMQRVGGRFECRSHPGGGTRITLHVPISR